MSSITETGQNLNKIQDLIKKHKIDAIFCTLGINFRYLFNSKANITERLILSIILPNNAPEIICPSFEIKNFEASTPIPPENFHAWEETENPFTLLASALKSLGIIDGSIAISPSMPYKFFSKIEEVMPQASFKDAYPLFKEARIIKTETELKYLRDANKFTALGIELVFDQLKEGMTENQISRLTSEEMSNLSGEPSKFAAVQIQEHSAYPHGLPTNKKLHKNNVVLIDAGTTVEGYHGDITNTTFFGTPTKEFLEIYILVEDANQLAIDVAKAGETPKNVDLAGREFLDFDLFQLLKTC